MKPLDGKGYPFHLDSGYLDCGARMMAVADMYAALRQARPYRETGMSVENTFKILKSSADSSKLDK